MAKGYVKAVPIGRGRGRKVLKHYEPVGVTCIIADGWERA